MLILMSIALSPVGRLPYREVYWLPEYDPEVPQPPTPHPGPPNPGDPIGTPPSPGDPAPQPPLPGGPGPVHPDIRREPVAY